MPFLGLPLLALAADNTRSITAYQDAGAASGANWLSEWKFASGFASSSTYDDNRFIQPNNKREGLIFSFTPEMAIGRGDYIQELNVVSIKQEVVEGLDDSLDGLKRDNLFFSYNPTLSLFSREDESDTLDHNFRLATRQSAAFSAVAAQLLYQTETTSNIEIGGLTKRKNVSATIDASYNFSEKVTVTSLGRANRESFSNGLSSSEVRAAAALSYRVRPKTILGTEIAAGRLQPESGATQIFLVPSFKYDFGPVAKLRFNGSLGMDLRQFGDSAADRAYFIFDVAGRYDVSEGRSVALAARREIRASARYTGENLLNTTYEARFQQRLFRRYELTLFAGRSRDAYENNQGNPTVARHDDYYFGRIAFTRNLGRSSRVGFDYAHNQNKSSDPTFEFTRNTYSVTYAYAF